MRADMSESVENEWLCAKLLVESSFEAAHTDMAQCSGQKVLVVERVFKTIRAGVTAQARRVMDNL